MWESPLSLSLSFLTHRVYRCRRLSVRPCALSPIFTFFAPSIWVPPLPILRRVQSILQGRLFSYLFLWWDFYNRVSFAEIFLLIWSTLFWLFLSSILVLWCPLLIFPSLIIIIIINNNSYNDYYFNDDNDNLIRVLWKSLWLMVPFNSRWLLNFINHSSTCVVSTYATIRPPFPVYTILLNLVFIFTLFYFFLSFFLSFCFSDLSRYIF